MARVNDIEKWLKSGRTDPTPTAPTPDPTNAAGADDGVASPIVPETPLETEVPPADDSPELPPAAAATDDDESRKPNAPFRKIRSLEKEVRELRARIDRNGATPPAAAGPVELPSLDEKPVDNLDMRLRNLEQQLMVERSRNNALQANQNAIMQEENYRRSHPEYDKAAKYLEDSEKKIWSGTKGITALAAQMLDQNEQYFEREASLRGIAAEDLALQAAENQVLAGGRAQLAAIAEKTGQSLPEVVMAAAEARGFNNRRPADPATPASALRRVQASVERQRAESLSTMSPGNTSAPRVIADKEALDEFLQTADPSERARFINERDAEDPGWLERMFAR
jgi:hypothetical protein